MAKPASPKGLNRRQWAAALAGSLVPLSGRAQAPAAQPSTELDAQRDRLRGSQNAIRQARVPRETEPAFLFRA